MSYNANTLNLMEGKMQEMTDANNVEYHRTHWIDDVTPLSATNLNNLEAGVETLYTLFNEQGYLTMRERTLNFTNFAYTYQHYQGDEIEYFPDSSNSERFEYCFAYCPNLIHYPSTLDITKATVVDHMFSYCSMLLSVPSVLPNVVNAANYILNSPLLSGVYVFNIPKARYLDSFMSNCIAITKTKFVFDTISVKDTCRYICSGCTQLTELEFENMYVSASIKFNTITGACSNCISLQKVKGLNYTGVTQEAKAKDVFFKCYSLITIEDIGTIYVSIDLGDCENLSRESAIYVINSLTAISSRMTLTLNSNTANLLSTEEKQIAIDKGWTIVVREANYV